MLVCCWLVSLGSWGVGVGSRGWSVPVLSVGVGRVFLSWYLVGVLLYTQFSNSWSDSWISSSKFLELLSMPIGVLLLLAIVCVKTNLLDVE